VQKYADLGAGEQQMRETTKMRALLEDLDEAKVWPEEVYMAIEDVREALDQLEEALTAGSVIE
jgi:hypothetical protein